MSNSVKKLINRFEANLPSHLHSALVCVKDEKGIIQSAFNLLTYFCAKIEIDEEPSNDVVSAVAMYLRAAQPEKRYKTRLRHRKVRQDLKRMIGDVDMVSGEILDDDVVYELAERHHYSEENIKNIIAEEPNLIVEFCEQGCAGDEVPYDLMKVMVPFVSVIRKEIMDGGSNGEEMRNRLGLHGYAWWKGAEELHREIIQDMARLKGEGKSRTESLNILEKRTGLKRGTIQKILRRSRDNKRV